MTLILGSFLIASAIVPSLGAPKAAECLDCLRAGGVMPDQIASAATLDTVTLISVCDMMEELYAFHRNARVLAEHVAHRAMPAPDS